MIVDAQVQYNQLQKLGYTFTPVQKQITTERKKVFTPFLSVSANTLGYVGTGGGLYYNNLGFEAKYLTDFQKKGFELGPAYKILTTIVNNVNNPLWSIQIIQPQEVRPQINNVNNNSYRRLK